MNIKSLRLSECLKQINIKDFIKNNDKSFLHLYFGGGNGIYIICTYTRTKINYVIIEI